MLNFSLVSVDSLIKEYQPGTGVRPLSISLAELKMATRKDSLFRPKIRYTLRQTLNLGDHTRMLRTILSRG